MQIHLIPTFLFSMKITIHDDPGALERRLRALQKLKNTQVKVGLPEKAGGRLHFILAVQEHGSPLMHIPARPVIAPALRREETRRQMAEQMEAAVEAAWSGSDSRPALEAAGQAGADGIRAYIDSHIPPPNSRVTVYGGWVYNRKARKCVYVKGKGFDKPLFDTGNLYKAFDYEVDE